MNIKVLSQDLGFWTEEAVTVQRFMPAVGDYEKELIWCNHAGHTEERVECANINPNGQDSVWYENIQYCDKCPAWKRSDEIEWQDAPVGGFHV